MLYLFITVFFCYTTSPVCILVRLSFALPCLALPCFALLCFALVNSAHALCVCVCLYGLCHCCTRYSFIWTLRLRIIRVHHAKWTLFFFHSSTSFCHDYCCHCHCRCCIVVVYFCLAFVIQSCAKNGQILTYFQT